MEQYTLAISHGDIRMTINIKGTLVDPMGLPEVAEIRVTATLTGTGTLECSTASITTTELGAYDFNLVNGTFEIEVNGSDEFCLQGTVAVDDSVLTSSPYTLQELLAL